MKKAILFLLLLAVSCQGKQSAIQEDPSSTTAEIPGTWNNPVRVFDVEHNGHRYIVFHSRQGYGVTMQVIHDPDCNCAKQ